MGSGLRRANLLFGPGRGPRIGAGRGGVAYPRALLRPRGSLRYVRKERRLLAALTVPSCTIAA
eukprot:10698647-Alexandrium_andersonii.AAC.1